MFKRNPRSAAALAMIGALSGVAAFAQQAEPQKLERIEITGSRIKSISTESNTPVTSITKADIVSSQPVAIEEVVRSLPASYPSIGPGTNNGSGGLATVDLRGLGSNRTLVLFNGKRFVPSNLAGVVDTNNVPVALLDRIDLLTGGASAAYGADAVSGVVNFVLKKNFSGIDAQTSYSTSEKGDAKRYKSDITMGVNFDDGRGNAVLSIGTTRTNPLTQGQRDFGFYQLNSVTGARDGSSTAVPAIWAIGGLPQGSSLAGTQVIDATTGLLRPSTRADNYNFNPLNYYETPLERTNITALGRYKINDNAEVYTELFSVRSNVTLNLAPSGSFTSTYSVPIGNPFIPDPVRQQLCAALNIAAGNCVVGNATEFKASVRRRFTELGPRINTFDNTTQQYTVGLRGDLPVLQDWSYDIYYQSGRSDQVSGRVNWGSFSKVQQALRSLNTTSCTNTANGCVPLNLFGPQGSITPAMLNFVNLSAFGTTRVEQQVTAASVSGEVGVVKSPLARLPLNLALGAEFREVSGGNTSDGATQTAGEVLGTGAPTPDRSGKIKFNEYFMEASLPLVSGKPGIKALNAEAGYRDTTFKTASGSQNYGSWKVGLDYTPFTGLRFRGQQQRATRAPNINELYQPIVTGLSNLATDPCQGASINPADAGKAGTLTNLCQQTGVPTNQIGSVAAPSAGQVNSTSGGNPNLGPEQATTSTIGLVFEPEFAKGLSVTLDYWRIKIDKAVSSATVPQTVSGCYTAALNPGLAYNAFCQAIQRDGLTGGLNNGTGVSTQSSNLGKYDTSGVDLGANYRLMLKDLGAPNWGRVDLSLLVSYQGKYDFKSLPLDTVPTIKCAGFYGLDCGTPYSKTKWTQRATWSFGDFAFGYNWRHLSSVVVQQDSNTWLPDYSSIKAFDYVDLSGSWQVLKNLKVALAVNNAFNRQPPIVGNTIGGTGPNSGNTFPLTYDVIGRRYTATLQATF